MDYHDIFHLDQSIGFFKISELMGNLRENGMWINGVDERGDTPVHIAARHKNVDLACHMLSQFHRVNLVNAQGDTALHVVIENCMSHETTTAKPAAALDVVRALASTYFNKRHRLIRALISKGADLAIKNNQGMTPVHLAAKHCHIDVLKIFKSSSDFTVRTANGETLLHLVCKYMSALKDTPAEVELIDYLASQIPDVCNSQDKEGYSPLHYAIWSCSIKGVERLVRLGADVYCRSHKRRLTPLHLAALVSSPSVIQLLVDFDGDVNARDASGRTPLHLVSLRGCRNDAMELLLSLGARVDALDHKGCLPLDYVLESQNVEGLERLLEYGADVIDIAALQRIPVARIMNGRSLEIHVLKHLTRLRAAGLPVCRDYEPYLERTCLKTYRRTCEVEVGKLKRFVMDDGGFSLYDLLHRKSKCAFALPHELRYNFPNYCGVLKASMHGVVKRESLLRLAKFAFCRLLGEITDGIAERVLDYLNDGQLIAVIESVESR